MTLPMPEPAGEDGGTSQVRGGRKVQFATAAVPPAPAQPRGPDAAQPLTPAPHPHSTPPSTKPTYPLYLPGQPREERPAEPQEQAQGPAPAAHVLVQQQQQPQPNYTQPHPRFPACPCMVCEGKIVQVGDNVIGVGGQAKVYKYEYAWGQHQGFRAVKVFSDRDQVEDVFEAAKDLKTELGNHPNILEYLDIFLCTKNGGKEACIMMPFCDGGDLNKKARSNKGLPEKEVREVMRQVGLGLEHMHHMGLVHSDVKPENILIATEASGAMVYKLADLDSSGIIRDDTHFSIKGITRRFSSPGMLLGYKARMKDDIWCLGTTALVLLTGKERKNTYAYDLQTNKNFRKEIESWVRQSAVVSQELMDIIFRMLQQQEDDRPSAEELIALLDGTAPGPPPAAAGGAPAQEADPPYGLRAANPPAPLLPPVAETAPLADLQRDPRRLTNPKGAAVPVAPAPPPPPSPPLPPSRANIWWLFLPFWLAILVGVVSLTNWPVPMAATLFLPLLLPQWGSLGPQQAGALCLTILVALIGALLALGVLHEGHLYRVRALVSPPRLVQEGGRYVIKGAGLPRQGEKELAEELVNGVASAILPMLDDERSNTLEDIFSYSVTSAHSLRNYLQPYVAIDDKTGQMTHSDYINYDTYKRPRATQNSYIQDYAWSMQLALYMIQRNFFKALPEEVTIKAMEDLGASGRANFNAFNPATHLPDRVLSDLREARRKMTPEQIAECKSAIRNNLNFHLNAYAERVGKGESFGEWARVP